MPLLGPLVLPLLPSTLLHTRCPHAFCLVLTLLCCVRDSLQAQELAYANYRISQLERALAMAEMHACAGTIAAGNWRKTAAILTQRLASAHRQVRAARAVAGVSAGVAVQWGQTAATERAAREQTEARLADTECQLATLQQRLAVSRAREAELQSRLVITEEDLWVAENGLQASDAQRAQLQAKFERARLRLSEAQLQLTETQSQLAETVTQLAGTQSQLADTQSQLADTQSQLAGTQSQLAASEAEKTEMKQTMERLLARVQELENINTILRVSLLSLITVRVCVCVCLRVLGYTENCHIPVPVMHWLFAALLTWPVCVCVCVCVCPHRPVTRQAPSPPVYQTSHCHWMGAHLSVATHHCTTRKLSMAPHRCTTHKHWMATHHWTSALPMGTVNMSHTVTPTMTTRVRSALATPAANPTCVEKHQTCRPAPVRLALPPSVCRSTSSKPAQSRLRPQLPQQQQQQQPLRSRPPQPCLCLQQLPHQQQQQQPRKSDLGHTRVRVCVRLTVWVAFSAQRLTEGLLCHTVGHTV